MLALIESKAVSVSGSYLRKKSAAALKWRSGILAE